MNAQTTYRAIISPATDEATMDRIGGLELTVIYDRAGGVSGPMFTERCPYIADVDTMIETCASVLARFELRTIGEWTTRPVGDGDGEWTIATLERFDPAAQVVTGARRGHLAAVR